jgi:hypothetical protein
MLPNGSWLPGNVQGRNLKEKFEAWHTQNHRTTRDVPPHIRDPPVSSNIIRVQHQEPASVLHASIETDDEDEDDDTEPFRVFAGESSQPKRKVRFDGVEVPPRNYGKDRAKPGESSKPTPPKNPVPATSNRAPAPKPTAPPTGARHDPITASQPQYRYQSPIEDPTIAKNIINRALDTSISLSQRELLAISPDLRRQMKDLTTSKKIANEVTIQEVLHTSAIRTPVRVCDNCDGSVEMIVGRDSVPLSSVYPLIAGAHRFENVLDSGSEINGIRQDIWEAIGEPLHGSTMVMQSANNTQNETVGKLRNLRVTFGDMDLYMQMQVVEDAAYEVLLGKPFFALTRCTSKFFANGDEHITLTDPNTGRMVTILAVEHNAKNRREMSDSGKTGWRATARRRQQHANHDDDSPVQLYIHVIPQSDPEPQTDLDEPPAEPMDVDGPLQGMTETETPDIPAETQIPDTLSSGSATPTQQNPLPNPQIKIFFDKTNPVPLQPDEDLIELLLECPDESPEPIRSLITLIDDFQDYLMAEDDESDDDELVEVMEMAAPTP